MTSTQTTVIRNLGLSDYQSTWQAMKTFTDARGQNSADEIWFLEHPPVFTLGQAGKKEHILNISDIPIVDSDRGGQVTYHGPGQLIAYLLLDIRRLGIGARALVTAIEQSVIALLQDIDIDAYAKPDAPGVYVAEAKIAALGLRIRKGCSYHGLSLNVDMDLKPFSLINPCGYEGLALSQIKDFRNDMTIEVVQSQLQEKLFQQLKLS